MIGTTLQGRYRLDAEIGRGGLGVVYRGHDTLLDRQVAVKVLSPAMLGVEARARLLREAQAVAKLHHPNIVAVHDAGESDGVPFIVMELVEGASLHERPPQAITEVVAVAEQICAALDHAHAHGIIHRDLKPENVVVTPDGVAKLMDFGLARSAASRITVEGTIAGTVFYMAPEQALGQAIDQRTDLYALGVMLYELAAGRLPFMAGDPLAIISQHVNAPVVPPSAYNAQIPAGLDSLIVRLMSKQAVDRPQTAVEVRQALAKVDGTPAPAKEVPLLERIGRGRLVARERELADMEAVWRRAAAGEGHVLLVSGEPGVGKTRLVRELMIRAQVGGGKALFGASYVESGAPYAPIADMIRQSMAGAGDLSLPDPVLSDLLTLAPDLCARYPSVPANPRLDPQFEQQRVFESVVAWCSTLAAQAPLMLVLDDVHWADSGALALVQHLARRTREQRVLIVGAYREVELDEARPWHQLLVDLNRERLSTRVKLGRLSREQTGDLLAAIFDDQIPDGFLDGIYRETEGNPFFVEEVCKALIEDGTLSFSDGHWRRGNIEDIHVPQSVRIALQMRVGKLPPQTQDTLRMAAILGRDFDFDTLAKASDLGDDALIAALEEAERAQLVVEKPVAKTGQVTLSFAHALTASTLRESVSGLRRQRLHRRAAAAVESTHPDAVEALAYHLHQAGDVERARAFYVRAGDRSLAIYAYREAEQSLRTALELGGEPGERAHVLSSLGEALFRQGRLEDAIASWREAIELYRTLADFDAVAQLYARLAYTAWNAGRTGEAVEISDEGMAALTGQAETPGLGALLHEAARAGYFGGRARESRPLVERALRIAEQTADAELTAQSLSTFGLILGVEGRYEEAIEVHKRAVRVAESAGLWMTAGRAYNNLGAALGDGLGNTRGALDCQRRATELARRARVPAAEAFNVSNEILLSCDLGELAHADEFLRLLQALVRSLVDPGQAALQLGFCQIVLRRVRGELEEAERLQGEALAFALRQGNAYHVAGTTISLAEQLIEKGDHAGAESLLLNMLGLAEQFGWGLLLRCYLCITCAHQGRSLDAGHWLDEARQKAGERLSPFDCCHLLRAGAARAVCEKSWAEAFAQLEDLSSELERLEHRPTQALILREWADGHLARKEAGDIERARELLQQALALYEQMGAQGYIALVRGRLDALSTL
jgi:eukaryotic-like serine/threonine-protein kinase